jgi:Na+/proline symporter
MMLGSIPQQDVFQRVMSANTEKAATHGTVIGGSAYILFAFVPMFLVASALLIMPEQAAELLQEDPQKVLPTLVMTRMPLVMQVLFFGALLSAIKSCASATLLAPSVLYREHLAPVPPRAHQRPRKAAHNAHQRAGLCRGRAGLLHQDGGHAHL